MEDTQTSIDVIDSVRRFPRTYFVYREKFIEILKRGVKVRAILDAPQEKESFALIKGAVNDFKKYSHKHKYLLKPPPAIIAIHDKKEVLITTVATANLAESPCLWSNNPSLLAILQDYFETLWLKAMEEIPEKH